MMFGGLLDCNCGGFPYNPRQTRVPGGLESVGRIGKTVQFRCGAAAVTGDRRLMTHYSASEWEGEVTEG